MCILPVGRMPLKTRAFCSLTPPSLVPSVSCCTLCSQHPVFPIPKPKSPIPRSARSEEHTSELQSRLHLVCRLLLEKKTLHHYVSLTSCRASASDRGLAGRVSVPDAPAHRIAGLPLGQNRAQARVGSVPYTNWDRPG